MISFLKKINIKATVIVTLFFLVTLFILFNEFGLLKFLRLQKEVRDSKREIQLVNEQNKLLRNEVDSLERKVPAKIERTAREKYGMMRKGEKAIEIITK